MADRAKGYIEIRNLYKIFGRTPEDFVDALNGGMTKTELNEKHGHVLGLKNINISIPEGSIQVIMGLSGSGKSTLIRHINRLIDPTAGEVLVDGVDVIKMDRNTLRDFRRHLTAMVFQKFALFPHRNVLENTVYGLDVQGIPRLTQVETAMRWIDRVGLKGFEQSYPNQLSGGMQQRVGLARALTNDAPILLMDEAFSALDPLIRMDMQSMLLDLQREIRKTIVFITHDLDEALRLGDRITVLRDGEVVQQGTGQQIVLNPADDYIARFVRDVNRGRVIRVETIMDAGAIAPADALTIREGTLLEDAMRMMSQSAKHVARIVNADDRLIGALQLADVIDAVVVPAVVEDSEQEGVACTDINVRSGAI